MQWTDWHWLKQVLEASWSWWKVVVLSGPPLVVVLLLWAIGRVIARVLDRRPRESVRCRKCWYDLPSQLESVPGMWCGH